MGKRVAWDNFYGRVAWHKMQKHQLRVQPLCEMCLKEGRTTAAQCVDHVTPHKGDWNKFRLGKLQSLCFQHHNSTKKLIEQRGYDPAIGADGLPIDPRHPVYRHD